MPPLLAPPLLLLLLSQLALALDNGLGRRPPQGWRSWNAYGADITQEKMIAAAAAMVNRSRGHSLLDAGYTNCGLDDYWQACGTGTGGSFHNETGYPLVNLTRFPSMKAMTDRGHSLGLKMGWYANNCGCNEHQTVAGWGAAASPVPGPFPGRSAGDTDGIHHYEGDVAATVAFGFDGIKLDGCGEFKNLSVFAELLNQSGREVLMEDCHWGGDGPGSWGDGGALNRGPNHVPAWKWCPANFFRTSGDIANDWGSVWFNHQTVDRHQPWNATEDQVKTGPGCWAYPE